MFVIWSLEKKHKLELLKDAISGNWDRWGEEPVQFSTIAFILFFFFFAF